MKSWAKQTGFTIVELLIVIVVIAILAAITIVAYSGIQARSRDSARDATANTVKKALELYRADTGAYPMPASCINAGCTVSNLSSFLTPTYINAVPDDPGTPSKHVYYVTSATGDGYGLYVQYYETKTPCKFLSANGNIGWWNVSTPTC